jgi:hypothetical protein
MTEQTFIDDIINTNQTDYLSAIRVLLTQNNLKDNYFDIVTLLLSYSLPDSNIINIASRFINNDTFNISTYEAED